MGMTIELADQDYQYCLDYASGKTNIMALNNINRIIKAVADGNPLEQETVLDEIFCIVHPLSIMSTPELEHKAIMQIAEMLEPLCLPESEET